MILNAYAKVNLSLDITGKRPDGYHTLCSVFQSVSLCDTVTVEPADRVSVACSDGALNGENNICHKAAELFFKTAKISGGANIYIEKRIPSAGGLGGGSADAAAVLRALNELAARPLGEAELLKAAVSLGADVPFCLKGGTKLCEGIGEIMTDLPKLNGCFIVIAKKGTKSSTGDMYRALDGAAKRKRPDTNGFVRALENGNFSEAFANAYNCFESVCDQGTLAKAKAVARETNAVYCGLSGAGPSVVSVYSDSDSAVSAANVLSEMGFLTFNCQPVDSGIKIIE